MKEEVKLKANFTVSSGGRMNFGTGETRRLYFLRIANDDDDVTIAEAPHADERQARRAFAKLLREAADALENPED